MTSAEFLVALLSIVIIDVVLGGDNAIVIAMAARRLHPEQRKKAILWGTAGAVVLRITLTAMVVILLQIPLLQFTGGILLIWIALRLLKDQGGKEQGIKAGSNIFDAIKIIIAADLVMGVDNVLGVAGAAHGNLFLLITGLIISIPIVVWGSTVILRLIEKYPAIIYIGALILSWTAGKMIATDRIAEIILTKYIPFHEISIPITIMLIVILKSLINNRRIAMGMPTKHNN